MCSGRSAGLESRALAGCWEYPGHCTGIAVVDPCLQGYVSASASSPARSAATAIGASTYCCGGGAGGATPNAPPASIARPGLPFCRENANRTAGDDAYSGRFNGRLGDECLKQPGVGTMAHGREAYEAWGIEYNTERPHSSLGNLTPEQFAKNSAELVPSPTLCGPLHEQPT